MERVNKIAAFTMMDILTGMVIMSIVIAMVFYLMSATNQQAFNYQKIRIELNNYMLLKADLKRNVERAERIESIPNGFVLLSSENDIEYTKSDNLLLRNSENSRDTLYHYLSELNVRSVQSNTNEETNHLVEEIIIKLKFEEQILSCYFYKDYGLTAPINQILIREF